MKNNLITTENIENMIYNIRGVQVMLSSDVAKLYQVDTKVLNQSIKRNIKRFPKSFCFQLSSEEIDYLCLRSQFVTLNKSNNLRGQHYKYLPYVLTEQGIMMLSGLLKSDIAVRVNVQIIDAFVKMRHFIGSSLIEQQYINGLVIKHDNDIKILQETFDKLNKDIKVNTILFKGQFYDAYSLLMDILNKAKTEIIIFDNYAGKELLDLLKDIDKNILIVTNNLSDTLQEKYMKQYHNVRFIINNSFYIISENR